MFAKLKECKSIKEIYEVLGREPFEKVAAVLLILWSALPLPSIITHAMWAGKMLKGMCTVFICYQNTRPRLCLWDC